MSEPVQPRPERKFNAPLWAGILAVVAVGAIFFFNVLSPGEKLTIARLNPPVVAAIDGGSDLYPPNSSFAFTEDVKFGYLPAPTLTRLADGTIVAANPDTAEQTLGLKKPLADYTADEFAKLSVVPARSVTGPGTTQTWQQLLTDYGDATVVVPAIDSLEVLTPALETIDKEGRADAIIVRTASAEVAQAAAAHKITVMATGDLERRGVSAVTQAGATMVAVAADDPALHTWLGSDVKVWAMDVKNEAQLKTLAKDGVFGALAVNPFTVLPSEVKTD